MRILVTGVGGLAGEGVSKLLAGKGYEVIGADMQETAFPELTDFWLAPAARSDGYLEWLKLAAIGANVDLIIPTVQEELTVVAKGQSELPCPVMIGSFESVRIAQDKFRTAQVLAVAGVSVPRSSLPDKLISPDRVEALLGWPCLSKPRDSRGGRNVTVYDSPDDYPALTSLDDAYLVQEFVPGAEYTVNLFVDGDANSVVVLEKTALREGRTGNASDVKRVKAVDVVALALLAARAIGLTGPADMDIRRRDNGMPLILEINARFGENILHAPETLKAALQARLPQP